MRSQEEILERIRLRRPQDIPGFEWPEYVEHLTFSNALQFIYEGVAEEDWTDKSVYKREDIIAKMRDYMSFAVGKARNQRGISANRSILHYVAWIWLTGDDEFLSEIQQLYEKEYHAYGLPILEKISQHYGF